MLLGKGIHINAAELLAAALNQLGERANRLCFAYTG